jgi:hypothetical protein
MLLNKLKTPDYAKRAAEARSKDRAPQLHVVCDGLSVCVDAAKPLPADFVFC